MDVYLNQYWIHILFTEEKKKKYLFILCVVIIPLKVLILKIDNDVMKVLIPCNSFQSHD